MIVFRVQKDSRNIFHKVWNEIYLLFFFNVGLLIGNISFFKRHYLIIEICVFCILIYKLLNKRNRHVFKIELDTKKEILKVYYYQFVFLKYQQEIPLSLLKVYYKHKIYMRGKVPKTLEIKQNRKLVAEIKQQYNIGWTNAEIDRIYETLNNRVLNE